MALANTVTNQLCAVTLKTTDGIGKHELQISFLWSFYKLEEWLNLQGGDGVRLGEFVIKLLLYGDDIVLVVKLAHGL